MRGCGTTYAHKGFHIALVCAFALLSGGRIVLAENQPTKAQVLDALTAREPARGVHEPAGHRRRDGDERQFIETLLKKSRAPSRSTTGEGYENRQPEAEHRYRSDVRVQPAIVGPKAVPTLARLGRALGSPALKGATFLIGGHTDAAGDNSYNQSLS
jgi:hypothetical protein